MKIDDEDILSMDECDVDMTVVNAVRVNIRSQGRCLHSIRVVNIDAGYSLIGQLLKYQEELNETQEIGNTST